MRKVEEIDTAGVSVGNMSSDDIDALLSDLEHAAGDDSDSSESASETATTEPVPATGAGGQTEGKADASDGLDKDAADLEALLQDASAAAQEADQPGSEGPANPKAAAAGASHQESKAGDAQPQEEAAAPAEATESKPDGEPGTPSDVAEEQPALSPAERARRLGRLAARGLVELAIAVLTILDAPFSFLSLRIKTLLGYVGIATSVVAFATWIMGSVLRDR